MPLLSSDLAHSINGIKHIGTSIRLNNYQKLGEGFSFKYMHTFEVFAKVLNEKIKFYVVLTPLIRVIRPLNETQLIMNLGHRDNSNQNYLII